MDEPSILRLDRQNLPNPHILPPVPRVSLTITRGRVRERVRPITGRVFLIGAASDCDLVLGDLQFPEAYAYVFVDGTDVTIRRLGSGPALLVCGQPVDASELFHGDLVEMGPFELRVVIDHPPRRVGQHDEDATDEGTKHRDEADRLVAIDEVRMLLADVRAALGEHTAPLRLFDGLEKDSRKRDGREAMRVRASA
jgi:pSer/pThr/pTyr-binding forkhead associated (FHA) protein